ncbi:Oxidoreductase NAD-binding domain-containing protein 3 [Elsinoe fawcettii]|nr:Oxidoreductase NAD-binding domain-containing protein 3 [Elsinoe fawcettii]
MANAARSFRKTTSRPILLGASACTLTAAGYYGYARYNNVFESRGYGVDKNFVAASAKELKTTFPGSGFTKLILEESHMVNHNVKYLKFKLPEGDTRSGIQTINEPGHISFLVKQYPNGKGSGHMHSLKPGDELKVKPIHEFGYKPNQYSQVTILAGGAGITPFVQLIRRVLSDPRDQTKIHLVFSNHSEDDILLKSEFDGFAANKADRFAATYTVSESSWTGESKVHKGRVTRAIIEQALPAKSEWSKSKVLVCGPPPYIEAVAGQKGGFGWTQGSIGGILKDLGLEKDQVQKF